LEVLDQQPLGSLDCHRHHRGESGELTIELVQTLDIVRDADLAPLVSVRVDDT